MPNRFSQLKEKPGRRFEIAVYAGFCLMMTLLWLLVLPPVFAALGLLFLVLLCIGAYVLPSGTN